MSKYNKNSIITGPLDSYCLICESYLRDQNEISLHIAKPIHVKNLETVPYFEKYKDDHIRKVKMGYYCEFCNRLFSTAAKVGIHVSESQHNQNKGSQLLERTCGGVMAFGKIFISDKAWNGFVKGTCTLCNMEFDSESIHKTSQSHILNLIKINVEFVNNSTVYRKIDEETFHCLNCNEVFALQKLSDHFENSGHKDKILKFNHDSELIDCSKINEGLTNANTGSNAVSDSKAATKTSSITPEKKSAKNPKEYDAVLLESMKAKDYIKTHSIEGIMYCMLCEWLLDFHQIPRHVQSEHHLTMLKMHKDRLEKMSKVEENSSKDLSNDSVKSCEDDSNMNKVLESIADFQKNDINIDLVSSTAVCKKCSKHLGIDYNAIKAHIEEHKAKPNKKDMKQNLFTYSQKGTEGKNTTLFSKPVFLKRNDSDEAHTSRRSSVSSKSEEDIEAFAAQNNMSIHNRKVFCNLCQTHLPTSIKNLKQHINGANHKFRVAATPAPNTVAKVKSPSIRKIPISAFVKSVVGVENVLFQDVVINEKLCLNVLSFMFIKALNSSSWKCHSCDLTCPIEEIENHKKSDSHRKAMTDAPLVVVDSEFIREARTDLYHCGFCNIVESGWDNMDSHLSSVQHKENKNVSEWRLRQHAPQIRGHEMRQKLQMLAFMHMMSGNDSSNDSDSDWEPPKDKKKKNSITNS